MNNFIRKIFIRIILIIILIILKYKTSNKKIFDDITILGFGKDAKHEKERKEKMKLKKIIISTIIILKILSFETQCFAKCVYEFTKIAAEIVINN